MALNSGGNFSVQHHVTGYYFKVDSDQATTRNVKPDGSGTRDLGDSTYYWSSVFAESFRRDASNYIKFESGTNNLLLVPMDHVVMHVEGSAISTGELSNSTMAFYISEGLGRVYVVVKDSGGNVKSGLVATVA